jgi:hypothetical protein
MYPIGTSGREAVLIVADVAVLDDNCVVKTLMIPPVMVTLFEFWVDIVPKPETAELEMAIATLDAAVAWP